MILQVGVHFDSPNDVGLSYAKEMAAVGIVPTSVGPEQEPIGHRFQMAGQWFVVTGYTSREAFIEAATRVIGRGGWDECPDSLKFFQCISTD